MPRFSKPKRKLITLATILLVGSIILYDSSSTGDESSFADHVIVMDEFRELTVIEDSSASVVQQQQLGGEDLQAAPWWGSEESNNNNVSSSSSSSTHHHRYYYLAGANENAGLGHSFMAFNNLVALARRHKLMPRFIFSTSGHDLTPVTVQKYFFGYEFLSPIPPGMECSTVDVASSESIPQLMSAAEAESSSGGEQEQGQEGCTIFNLHKPMKPVKSWESIGINLPLLRKQFQLNGHQDTVIRKDPQHTVAGADITIAVHIRRGDLFSYIKKHQDQAEGRLVTESAYVSVLKQLFSNLKARGKTNNINIVLYCEGMKDPSTIATVHAGTYDDMSKEFSPEDYSNLNVNWSSGASYTLQAFDDMCHSDILITGTSGFSYVASILCGKPVILAFPFWLPYRDIPNAIELDVEKGNYTLPHLNIHDTVRLTNHASFNESRFDSLFGTLISSGIASA